MNRKRLITLAPVLLAILLPPVSSTATGIQTPTVQESPELAEASELQKSVVRLYVEYKADEAIPLAQKALAIRERLLPATDRRVEESLEYLGIVYYATKNYKSAKGPLERALKLRESRVSAESPEIVPLLDRLGVCYFMNREEKAESVFLRSLSLKEKQFGPDHINLAPSLTNLANFYRWRKDLKRGIPAYERALSVLYKNSGDKSSDFQQTTNNFLCMGYENSDRKLPAEYEALRHRFTAVYTPGIYEVLNGKALSLPKPGYPNAARMQGMLGQVVVKVSIDETGKVYDASSMCGGWPVLAEAAIEAARTARFSPTYINGQPTKVTGVVVYNFVMR